MSAATLNEIRAELSLIKREFSDKFTFQDAKNTFKTMKLDPKKYSLTEFHIGLNVELEHGTAGAWNITNDDPIMTAKIALAHLDEVKDYYSKLLEFVDPE
jgi:hypothetical protein